MCSTKHLYKKPTFVLHASGRSSSWGRCWPLSLSLETSLRVWGIKRYYFIFYVFPWDWWCDGVKIKCILFCWSAQWLLMRSVGGENARLVSSVPDLILILSEDWRHQSPDITLTSVLPHPSQISPVWPAWKPHSWRRVFSCLRSSPSQPSQRSPNILPRLEETSSY